MIRSMTCFSRLSESARLGDWSIEIRSVNHRYFEFSFRSGQEWYSLESQVRELVQSAMRRGKINVTVSKNHNQESLSSLKLDEKAVQFYLQSFKKMKRKFGLKGELTFSELAQLPRVFTSEKSDESSEKDWPSLKKALQKALKKAIRSKELEGQNLAKDIKMRLDKISDLVSRVEKHTGQHSDKYYQRLSEKVTALAGDAGLDTDRLHREVAFLAERSDITEEIVRLKSHLGLFNKKIQQSVEVGRELDFLCQEMNREVNTMGSKSQFFEISTQVVAMKRELEKIREQVQNVE